MPRTLGRAGEEVVSAGRRRWGGSTTVAGGLAATLPDRAVVGHWTLAWAGFAIIVAAGLVVTAICVVRNSPWTVVAASATGAVVLIDAWFDLMTREAPRDLGAPVVRVLLLKAPLGALCLLASAAMLRRLSAGRNILT